MFRGDHIWMDMFGAYFDDEKHYPSHNIRDLDTNDINVHKDLMQIFEEKQQFDLLVAHFLGIDHAGHTFHANHTEIERKIKETQVILEDIIKNMDNETVLLLYGDHGMTTDGNHGGDSNNEVRTVFFAYTKAGFPMLRPSLKVNFQQELQKAHAFDDMSLHDVASIASNLLDLPVPFSSLGILHPALSPDSSPKQLPSRMLANLH